MFTEKDFDALHKLWDGKATNSKGVCGSCGACCHNTEKILFPGEYDYAVKKSGQMNSDWKSSGCLCYNIKDKYKPVICKLFPIKIEVPLEGPIFIDWEATDSDYSKKCEELLYPKDVRVKAEAFISYLFSSVSNRVFYILQFGLDEAEEEEIKILDALEYHAPVEELHERTLYRAFGLPVKEIFSHHKF